MAFTPKTVTLYSVGLLGGSIGLALKHSGFSGRIIGLSSPAKLPLAIKLGCIDEGYPYEFLGQIIGRTDLLVLCSPISVIMRAIETLATLPLPQGLVITDVGSTKQEIAACAARVLPSHVHFIGGHPMAGSEKSGPSAADPYLFQNAIHVLTPPTTTPAERDLDIALFFEHYLGSRTLFLDAERHDRIVAAVSHVPHLLAVALVNVAQEVEMKIPGTLTLAAGGFRDMTRIAGASYDLWHDILSTNKNAIEPLIGDMIGHLANMKERLRTDELRDLFEQSRRTRSSIPINAKGFIRQLSEVLVVAKDQPGFLAAMAVALAEKKINIKDFEVLKVREGEGGTIKLAFDSPEVAQEAIAVLQGAGFSARERA
jgi:prephenate dehydrogenase